VNTEKKAANFYWPNVLTTEGARTAAKGGVTAACFVVAITSALALYGIFEEPILNVTPWSFIDAFLFAVVAFGIWKMSRVAAFAGLVLYLIEQAIAWATIGPKAPVVAALFILLFVNALRGTFSYHRLMNKPATAGAMSAASGGLPTHPESLDALGSPRRVRFMLSLLILLSVLVVLGVYFRVI
jgi:hypothetical protein